MTNSNGQIPYDQAIEEENGFNSFTEEQFENWFTYHEASPGQIKGYQEIREAAKVFARVMNFYCPPSADKTDAIRRKLREVVMTANAAIACGGK